MRPKLAWLLLLSGCYDWDALEPGPTLELAPACVEPGAAVAVRWTGRDCVARELDRDVSDVEGCFTTTIDARTTFAVECVNGAIERTAYVDDPAAVAEGRALRHVAPIFDAALTEWGSDGGLRVQEPSPGFPVPESDLRARVYLGWNEAGLVFGADIEDDSIETTDIQQRGLFRNDGIEIVVDGGADGNTCAPDCPLVWEDGEWQLFFDADGRIGATQRDLLPSDGVLLVTSRQEFSYILEGLVPWPLLAFGDAAPLRQIRINLAINDRDGGIRDEDVPPALLWVYQERHHRNPSGWPLFVLRCGGQEPASCSAGM